jgi:large subunit ribosomal protein L23
VSEAREIILRPVVSEKSYALIEENSYTFLVHPDANKVQIRHAVEEIWRVKVLSVNTSNRKGKVKLNRVTKGTRKNTRRAIVKLAPGDKIELFETR